MDNQITTRQKKKKIKAWIKYQDKPNLRAMWLYQKQNSLRSKNKKKKKFTFNQKSPIKSTTRRN